MAATMIGGAFLSATVQTLVEKLASKEFLDYIKNTKLNVSLLRQLKTTLLTLHVVLDDAEEKQINNSAVKQWLDDLKDAVFDAEDLLNQISYESLRCKVENTKAQNKTNQVLNFLSSPFKNFYGEINSQMKIMCENLQLFAQNKDILGLQTKTARVSRRTPSSSVVNESVIVGRKNDKQTIMNMLLSKRDTTHNNIGVVAILGMGGLGKTTLAQLVYNDKEVQQHFNLKAWVCVSEDFDIMRVTKSLLESVTSRPWDTNNLDVLRVELRKNSREKRFLFVLDDLWNDNYSDWEELVSPFIVGKPGSMVIITTRQQKVAEVAHTFPIHELKTLSNEDCWSLLSKHALGSDEFHHSINTTLEEIGRKIAKKCGGLPIAAKTLGGLLRLKVDIKEWDSILNSNVWNLQNDNILPALHLSYQYLPSHLKRCFAYCSIFPKDLPLDRKQLVLLWMAEGFLDCSQGGRNLEELGDDCFAELLSRSLFQPSRDDAPEDTFVMHDLVNDLARVVAGKSCCMFECGETFEKVRHVSYIQDQYDIFTKFKHFHNFKCLRSFLPIYFWRVNHTYLSFKVVYELIPSLKSLRVLSLSNYKNITKLPDTICNLVQLRYLDLSFIKIESLPDTICNLYNLQTLILSNCLYLTELPVYIGNLLQLRYLDLSETKIESLPDTTCNLYNLQTLILSCCRSLTELPVHIGHLVSLRHLDISETNISELPVEIGGLENLQTLPLFLVGKRHVGLSIKELRKFTNLHGKLTIKNLDNVVDATEAHDVNLKSKEKIEELHLIWGEQSEDSQTVKVVLDMLQPPLNLKSLSICFYGGTNFPSWLGNSLFSNMVSLRIIDCEYCWRLPPLGHLPSLKDLEICGMKMLVTIGPEFYYIQEEEGTNSSFKPFPSLERIKFDNMPIWNEWLPFEGINFAFPRLRTMELHNCPELRGHFPSNLPFIEEIEISGCSHLLEARPTLHWLSSSIKKITIDGVDGMTQLSLLGIDSPCTMQKVVINNCVELLAVPKLILRSTCLTYLILDSLSSLTAFPSSGLPTSLQLLHIEKCENLSFLPPETWINYTSLVSLQLLCSCDALTSFPVDGFPALQSLGIIDCRSFDSIYILESPSHPSSSLRSLTIQSNDSIKLFKVKFLMNLLTALEDLNLICQELSFSEGVCLPPKLQTIQIYSQITTPPFTEWGLQDLTTLSDMLIGNGDDIFNILMNDTLIPIYLLFFGCDFNFLDCRSLESLPENLLPSSLKSLQFWSCEKLKTLPEGSLPSSLETLEFHECEKLKTLPEGSLPSSLETLEFDDCEKLESLPEDSLPDSLKVLVIKGCPLLEERYKRKEHWSKISHIPFIKINKQVTI